MAISVSGLMSGPPQGQTRIARIEPSHIRQCCLVGALKPAHIQGATFAHLGGKDVVVPDWRAGQHLEAVALQRMLEGVPGKIVKVINDELGKEISLQYHVEVGDFHDADGILGKLRPHRGQKAGDGRQML